MEGLIFWIVVIVIMVVKAIIGKPEEKNSSASGKGSIWGDFAGNSQNKLDDQWIPVIPKREPVRNYAPVEEFQPIEVKTGSAMADLIPIWEAAGRGKYEIVEEKLAAGTNVNEPDTFFGETALHRAAKAGDLKMVKLLLAYGARVDLTDQYGETPLHFAIRGHNPDVIRLLLEQGADPDWEDIFGRTPAQCARFYTELRNCFVGATPT